MLQTCTAHIGSSDKLEKDALGGTVWMTIQIIEFYRFPNSSVLTI